RLPVTSCSIVGYRDNWRQRASGRGAGREGSGPSRHWSVARVAGLTPRHGSDLALRRDVAVGAEHILRVPPSLHLGQPAQTRTQRGLDPIWPLVLSQEVDVGPAGGERLHVVPRGAGPIDVGLVLTRLLPGSGDVESVPSVPIAHGRVLLIEPVERTSHVEQDHRR